MGDTVVLLTSNEEPYKCYKADSGILVFKVKTRANFATLILIAKKKPHNSLYEVKLGIPSSITNLKNGLSVSTIIQITLHREEYKEFWLTWYGNLIRLGEAGDTKPFLACDIVAENRNEIIGFVKLGTRSNTAPVQWIFQSAPVLPMPSRVIHGGEPTWQPMRSGDSLPLNAFVGGMERGEPLYVARAHHEGSVTPGKYLRSRGAAFIGWWHVEYKKQEFEILCGYNMRWVPGIYNGPPPAGAIIAGVSQNDTRDLLFSIRVRHRGDLVPGKQHEGHGNCYIPYDGEEVPMQCDFEILIGTPGPENGLELL